MSDEVGNGPRTLADLPPGEGGRIAGIDGGDVLHQRLLELGLTEGTDVLVVRYAPLGDPMEIRVRGYFLTLRRKDARGVRLR
ncbi:MAG: ferrous iron transport protein A [Planctomycetota bacterium]